jgi:5'-nucleotidase
VKLRRQVKRPAIRIGSRATQGGLVAVSLGAVLLAPLAAAGPAGSAAPTISGARSLTDTVSVSFQQPGKSTRTSDVHVLAWNDFHGNLEPAALNIYGRFAGGAAYLSKVVKSKQAEYGRSQATVLAGDNIGAAPLANALFNEEPAIIASNLMHVDYSSVGNHEFDKGSAELLRIQKGGCKPDTGCLGAPYAKVNGHSTNRYPGADFQYLSANVINDATGKPLFPAYGIKRLETSDRHHVSVGFIGEVLHDTPTIVTPSGVAGLSFTDEATAANKAVKQLKKKGVKIPILVIHQGGFQSGTPALNGCAGNLDGSPIAAIAAQLDPSIKIIISGHTHAEYRCTITTNGVTRLITSAASFGRILSDLTLTVNDRTGELVRAVATNTIVENALNAPGPGVSRVDDPSKADPVVANVVRQYVTASAQLANRVIGKIQGDLTRAASGESTLGDVIADAQLASTSSDTTGNAVVAFMNPGGIRDDLLASQVSGGEAVGEVTYGEAFRVQPFGNSLVTKTMTGAQIRSLLEQQFAGCGGQITSKTLQISAGLKYETAAIPASPTPEQCAAQIGAISINGTAIDPAGSYRVTMNNFLATGGDGFTVFNSGTDVLGGAQDIDSFAAYLGAAGTTGVAVPTLGRIVPKP